MSKLVSTILLITTLGCHSNSHANDTNTPTKDSGLNSYIMRGDMAAYEQTEKDFIQAAINSNDDELYKLISPLTKQDSSEGELKVFVAAMKDYFSEYASDMKCKSIVPKNDEYGNVGFLFFNAFKKSNGGGRAYVMALIKENETVYVATVFRKFDEEFHARCRNNL